MVWRGLLWWYIPHGRGGRSSIRRKLTPTRRRAIWSRRKRLLKCTITRAWLGPRRHLLRRGIRRVCQVGVSSVVVRQALGQACTRSAVHVGEHTGSRKV
ncbi:hypothetical protein SERLADRAFT_474962 [Serpula lacrymans var. lacrymans S7.9]|uniref:Uncharacterized protein n=1 Tax=Serpula lacrymans var. lacrymans (strain S7.9) TaxID=578457 RepID=F8P5M2_SERL9|nr:uncharacterized protein SERLADRAFT_474962 [Serpula lacrymans var. lacrymans S7.9]EGO21909.1 hypothetical protein SERLADRAFT_474962 [Serpula lacrymans var. lacrymans S7.9]